MERAESGGCEEGLDMVPEQWCQHKFDNRSGLTKRMKILRLTEARLLTETGVTNMEKHQKAPAVCSGLGETDTNARFSIHVDAQRCLFTQMQK